MTDASRPRIAVIGSGMAGLACARALADAGHAPVIFDKGRKPGGRLSLRQSREGLQFDHGAQYVTAKSDAFSAFLDQAIAVGDAAIWDIDLENEDSERRVVGFPGMSSLLGHLSPGLEIRQGLRVTALVEYEDHVALHAEKTVSQFDIVAITTPVVQTRDICAADEAFLDRMPRVEMEPCWTFMGAMKAGQSAPFTCLRNPDPAVSWIALNSTKPGRDQDYDCWVLQASPEWSAENLEREADDVAEQLGRMLCDKIGCDPAEFVYARAHRWRYSQVKTSLGQPLIRSDGGRILAGGDWSLGKRAEHAFISGQAIARDLLKGLE
ncbi:MAG: NAD(P)-binding protein [Litoreibacter sp.]|nr:NAD(P)-binding protein [Litoreibacter sp.]